MKKTGSWLALASLFLVTKSPAVSLDDIQFWIGSGTNRAALVVEWSAPESPGFTTVPPPVADKSLVWGYRFNGTATGTEMLMAIIAAEPRLYVVADLTWGTYVEGIGYSLDGSGATGLADAASTNLFTNNFLTDFTVDIDASSSLKPGDLYWGGYWGPNWEIWTEAGDAGGFPNSPDRGADSYWTPDDPANPFTGVHGQWQFATVGLDSLPLTNGSWIGFSVAAGEYESASTAPYNAHKHAPAAPDASLTALVKNMTGGFQGGQWQSKFLSCSNWLYTLERSADLQTWNAVGAGVAGTGTNLIATDPAPPADKSFYRVSAARP